MKFTKGKFASVAAAAVLAGTMGFMPATALASTVTDTATGLQKTWEVPSSAQFTNETFNFTLTYGSAEALNGNETAAPTNADGTAFSNKTISLSKSDFPADGTSKTATKTLADVFSGINFSKPGTYSFTLTENAGTNQNIVYNADNATYTIKVSVVWATDDSGAPTSDTTVSAVRIYSGNTKVESASFKNTDPNGNVTVSKTVKGVLANTTDEFSFSAELKDKNGAPLTGSYNYTKTTADGTTTGTYKSGDTFTLKSGETFEIENLPQDATYTVTETDDKGYDSTTVTAEGTTNSTQKDTKTTNASGAGSIANGDTDEVAFVNNKGFVPPATGITMNTLPFVAVGVVAVAGGAALVISRRRHAGEDF